MTKRNLCTLLLVLVVLIVPVAGCRKKEMPTLAPPATPTPALSTATATPIPAPPTLTPVVYVVKPGDSLSGIALEFDVPVEALAQANGIDDPNVIKEGQELIIPGPTPIPTATVPPTLTPTPNIPPAFEIVDVFGRGAPGEETVVIVNRGRGIKLQEWTLRDKQGNVFFFPDLYLESGAEIRVHTGKGENTPLHLYWNRDESVWAEKDDTAILADPRGVVYATKPLD